MEAQPMTESGQAQPGRPRAAGGASPPARDDPGPQIPPRVMPHGDRRESSDPAEEGTAPETEPGPDDEGDDPDGRYDDYVPV
jgi:hypothetical protein